MQIGKNERIITSIGVVKQRLAHQTHTRIGVCFGKLDLAIQSRLQDRGD